MKNLSTREKIMLMALPAVVLLMIYYFFMVSPKSEELEKLRRLVDAAETRVPTAQARSSVASDLREITKEVNAKRKVVQERKNRSQKVLDYWTNPEAKARSGEKIGQLLADNQVILLEESMAEGEDLQRFEPLLESLSDAQLWKLRMAGSYQAIQKTLTRLGETDLPIIPAAIEMEPMSEDTKSIHVWNLWICR
ncbi:MAG: type II secretion system protein GspM [Verrucomicrobiota bacterium]